MRAKRMARYTEHSTAYSSTEAMPVHTIDVVRGDLGRMRISLVLLRPAEGRENLSVGAPTNTASALEGLTGWRSSQLLNDEISPMRTASGLCV